MPGLPEPKTALPEASNTGSALGSAVHRFYLSLFIFGACFFVLALVLTKLVSPDRFPVRVGDSIVRLKDLESESARLTEKEQQLMSVRAGLSAEDKAPILTKAKMLQMNFENVGEALLFVEETRKSFTSNTQDPISFPDVEFSSISGAITLIGEVGDKDGRSVQLLASFIDQLRSSPLFERVSEPEYISRPTAEGGTATPFTLTLTLAGA